MNTRRKSKHQSVVMSSSHYLEFLSSPNTTRSEIFCVWGEGVSLYVCTCVRVGETQRSQWAKRLSNSSLAARFGLGADVADLLRNHRLPWVGHMARMDPSRLPK